MKILFLDPIKLTNKDGCGIHRLELIKSFTSLNHNVYIFLKGKVDTDLEYILNLPNIHASTIKSNGIKYNFIYIYLLFKVSIENRINLFYSRNVIYSIFGSIISKFKKSSFYFEKNGIISDEASSFNLSNKSNRLNVMQYMNIHFILETCELIILRHCDGVIAVTPLLRDYLLENGVADKKVYVIENGANTDMFKPISKAEARKKLDISNDRRYVCFVGHLAPWQGLKYLIHAIPLVVKEIPVYFMIVGSGPLYEELNMLSHELGVDQYLLFTGCVPYQDVPLYINSSDVCVAPFIKARNNRIGLSPLKIYEYMSCNKPVISSRIPNLEFIEEQNAGILFEPENVDELARSVIDFFNNYGEYDYQSSREYILKNNSWMGISKRILSTVVSK